MSYEEVLNEREFGLQVMEESPESYKDVTEVVNTCHDVGFLRKLSS